MGEGRVEIFKIELVDSSSGARLPLSGGRELDGNFYLDFGSFYLPLFPEQASGFARAISRLAWRRQQMTPKAASVWRRNLGSGDGDSFRVEVGLTDERCIYVEASSVKIVCDDAQSEVLLAVLVRFAEDVGFVASAGSSASEQAYQGNMVEGAREAMDWRMPPWAREF